MRHPRLLPSLLPSLRRLLLPLAVMAAATAAAQAPVITPAPAPAQAPATAPAAPAPRDTAPVAQAPSGAALPAAPAASPALAAGAGTPAAAPGLSAAAPAGRALPAPVLDRAPVQPLPGPSAGGLLQTIFGLLLVLGILAGLAWAAKRYGPRVAGHGANLRVVGALNIGGRERIMVIEVGEQWIVVGASPGRVNALATMPKGEAPAGATLAPHAGAASNFSDWLTKTIEQRNAK